MQSVIENETEQIKEFKKLTVSQSEEIDTVSESNKKPLNALLQKTG
jgi:hypothetical protein